MGGLGWHSIPVLNSKGVALLHKKQLPKRGLAGIKFTAAFPKWRELNLKPKKAKNKLKKHQLKITLHL
jgi:hypothetical protein